ncbi:MAG: glycosyltransferase family 39 protein [Candidatus Hydrogenedentes bacterium]|nr:glycosyltransferase family 39 protein [Candidatus Hydrogenedentota bacterium]
MSLLVMIAAAFVLGSALLGWLRIGDGLEGAAYRFVTGMCACGTLIMVLGSYAIGAAQLAVVAVAGVGVAYEVFVLARRRRGAPVSAAPRTPLGFVEYASLFTVGAALLLALVSALAPVTSWDAGVAHLSLPQSYAREGRISRLDGNPYSVYPQLMHALYTFVFSQAGETFAALLNWLFAANACVMAYSLGRRIESRRCGIIAAAILATSPIFIDQAGTVSLDLAFTCVATAALAALVSYHDERSARWLILAAYLAGCSCGIRHTGYLVCVLLGCSVALRRSGPRFRDAAYFAGVSLAAAAPWLLRAYLLCGNPVYPFLTSWFGDGGLTHLDISSLGAHESIKGLGLRQFVMFPWDIIMRPGMFDGWTKSPGGLVLILGIPGLAACGWRARRLGLYSIAGGVCFFAFQRFARYLLPFFVPMMVVAAVAACRLKGLRTIIACVLLVTFGYGLALDVALIHFKLPAVFGYQTREDYLKSRVERYPAFQWVNENISPASTILTLDVRSYYLKGRTYQNHDALRLLVNEPRTAQLNWLKSQNIKYVFYAQAYVEESPFYANTGLLGMFASWRRNPLNFRLLKSFDLLRPNHAGWEQVEVYEINYGDS